VLTDSDAIARISIVNKERHLIFSPTETSFGKDPAQLGDMPIPDASAPAYADCLAQVIDGIKEKLNALSEEQVARRSEIGWFTAHLPQVQDADGINGLLGRAKKAGRDVAKMVVNRAEELGLDFDPDARRYVYLEDAESDHEAA
jgi:hypothetical protein